MSIPTKTAIVTGASSGIGRALAIELAKQGWKVGVTARRSELLAGLVEEVRGAGGTIASAVADVTDRDRLLAAVGELTQELGPADLMIANAGVGYPTGANPVNAAGVTAMAQVNYLGVVYAFESVLPSMLERKSGHLVAISSLASYRGMPGAAGYCASKAAVSTYCEALRIELVGSGVAMTTVCPGFIRTAMTARNRDPMPLIMDVDIAAKKILHALKRRPKVYNFPWLLYRLIKFSRWLPDWLFARIAARPSFPE